MVRTPNQAFACGAIVVIATAIIAMPTLLRLLAPFRPDPPAGLRPAVLS